MPRDNANWLSVAPNARVTTIGRRSGKAYTTPIWFAANGDLILLLAHVQQDGSGPHWYENLRARGRARLESDGRAVDVRLPRNHESTSDLTSILEHFRAKYGAAAVAEWYDGERLIPVTVQLVEDAPGEGSK